MSRFLPPYLSMGADELSRGHDVRVRIVPDAAALATVMAEDILETIQSVLEAGRAPTLILPVGPIDQFPPLAEMINRRGLSLRSLVVINMDEYLTDADEWIPLEHPLSFRSLMQRSFYDRIDSALLPPQEGRVFPDPRDPDAIGRLIAGRGGVDACYGGIGINGHMAFNEPPEPGEEASRAEFADRPTRVLALSRESRTINANTVGGSLEVVPRRCVTVGMREILASRQLRFYCNRPWQSAVIRRVLHGPVSADCPASFLRGHPDATVTLTREVADPPQIMLR